VSARPPPGAAPVDATLPRTARAQITIRYPLKPAGRRAPEVERRIERRMASFQPSFDLNRDPYRRVGELMPFDALTVFRREVQKAEGAPR
jgi:hypothetical protein